MTTNAPYYQMRGQFNNANAQFAPTDDDYDLSASVTPHDASLYADRQGSDSAIAPLEENHNLVELLEAATTAAEQPAHTMNADLADASDGTTGEQAKSKRKRISSPRRGADSIAASQSQRHAASDSKRVRIDVPTDPQLQGSQTNQANQAVDGSMRTRSESSSLPPSSESLLNDARAAGVHSAAALFRRSSKETTRKYTRPPMSKLFMSLQLSPENFLHLQAQAKTYMLDPAHPERQSCVGNRGKGDTDMVKLRLFNCVRDFLNEDVGEQFFGEHVEKPGEKEADEAARALGEDKAPVEGKLLWPRDGNKIISLVTPLLRRMVTNERQRMYAIETRKGGTKKKEGSAEAVQTHGDLPTFGTADHEFDQLQAPFDPGNSLIQAQQTQIHQVPRPTSPVASLPAHHHHASESSHSQFAISPNVRTSVELNSFDTQELPLENPPEPNLRKINIYLTKKGIKLQPEKKIKAPETTLFHMSWEQFQDEVGLLIKSALSIYGVLEPNPIPSEIDQALKSMGPEALRGLAVAATEIQATSNDAANGDKIDRLDSLNTPSDTLVSTTSRLAQAASNISLAVKMGAMPLPVSPIETLPDYTVTAMCTQGLKPVRNEEDWHCVKLDVSFAIWAGGVLNIVVDLA